MTTPIDFQRIKHAAAGSIHDLVADWYPHGRRQGNKWRTGSLTGDEPGASAAIDLETGAGYDHARADLSAGDIISLYRMRWGCGDNGEAARKLADLLHIDPHITVDVTHTQAEPTGITLEQYCAAKGIDIRAAKRWHLADDTWFHAPCIRIPYLDTSGAVVRRRCRKALQKVNGGPDTRFTWYKDEKQADIIPYGIWHLSTWRKRRYRRIWAVEGESDCHVLWQAGEAAIGFPGATTVRKYPHWMQYLHGFPEVCLINEGGDAGESLTDVLRWSCVRSSLRIISCADRDDLSKDPSDLWNRCGRDHDAFIAILNESVAAATDADGQPVTTTKPLSILSPTGLEALATTTRPSIVDGLLRHGDIAALCAPPGEGKSLAAVELARCVASGQPFADKKCQHGHVLYAFTDAPDSTAKRIYGLDEYARSNIHCLDDLTIPADLDAFADACGRLGITLAIIDTWDSTRVHATGGYTEIDAGLEAILRPMRSICRDIGMACVIVHHSTRSDAGRLRGSQVLDARCDWIGAVSQEDTGVVVIKSVKVRDGERGFVGAWNVTTTTVGQDTVPQLDYVPGGVPDTLKDGEFMRMKKRIQDVITNPANAGKTITNQFIARQIGTNEKNGSLVRAMADLRKAGMIDKNKRWTGAFEDDTDLFA